MRLLPASPGPDAAAFEDWLELRARLAATARSSTASRRSSRPAGSSSAGMDRPRRGGTGSLGTAAHERISAQEASDAVRAVRRPGCAAPCRRRRNERRPAQRRNRLRDGRRRGGIRTRAVTPPAPRIHGDLPGPPGDRRGCADGERGVGCRASTPPRLRLRSGSVLGGALDYIDAWATPPSSPNLFFLRPLLDRARDDGITRAARRRGRRRGVLVRVRRCSRTGSGRGRLLSAWRLAGQFPEYGMPTTARGAPRASSASGVVPGEAGDAPRWWLLLVDGILGPGSRLVHDVSRRHAALAGIEPRHPLLDLDLIELALGLPPELAFDRRYNRPVTAPRNGGPGPGRRCACGPTRAASIPCSSTASSATSPAMERLLRDPSARRSAHTWIGEAARRLLGFASRRARRAAILVHRALAARDRRVLAAAARRQARVSHRRLVCSYPLPQPISARL